MSLARIEVDTEGLFRQALTDLERRQLPFATMQAINSTAFEVRQRWGEVMPRVFDRPTPLTTKAVLYRKATKSNLTAEIFIRDEAFKGTPPAKYLQAQVFGGNRGTKAFEKRLQSAGFLPVGWFAVPGKGAQLDAYGNLAGARMNRILSQLGARFDPLQNETDVSRGRRRKREARKHRGDYVPIRQRRGRLAPGIYQRVTTGFGSTLVSVLRFVERVRYRPRYNIHDMARKVYARRFPDIFKRELAEAVASAKARGWV